MIPKVFGLSQTCFNALSFLISSDKNVGEVFHNLGQLFVRISEFLERFVEYKKMETIDRSLKLMIRDFLLSFTRICTLSIEVLKHKFSVSMKAFWLDDDNGVKQEMAKLDRLSQRDGGMLGALAYRTISETKESLQGVEGKVYSV